MKLDLEAIDIGNYIDLKQREMKGCTVLEMMYCFYKEGHFYMKDDGLCHFDQSSTRLNHDGKTLMPVQISILTIDCTHHFFFDRHRHAGFLFLSHVSHVCHCYFENVDTKVGGTLRFEYF